MKTNKDYKQNSTVVVVISDLKEAGDEDVIAKVMADIEEAGLDITREQIVGKQSEYMVLAAAEMNIQPE